MVRRRDPHSSFLGVATHRRSAPRLWQFLAVAALGLAALGRGGPSPVAAGGRRQAAGGRRQAAGVQIFSTTFSDNVFHNVSA